jgi:hypothetical protein
MTFFRPKRQGLLCCHTKIFLTLVKSVPEKAYGDNKLYKSMLTLKSTGQKILTIKLLSAE